MALCIPKIISLSSYLKKKLHAKLLIAALSTSKCCHFHRVLITRFKQNIFLAVWTLKNWGAGGWCETWLVFCMCTSLFLCKYKVVVSFCQHQWSSESSGAKSWANTEKDRLHSHSQELASTSKQVTIFKQWSLYPTIFSLIIIFKNVTEVLHENVTPIKYMRILSDGLRTGQTCFTNFSFEKV